MYYPTADFMQTGSLDNYQENVKVKDIQYNLNNSEFAMDIDVEGNTADIRFKVTGFFEVKITQWDMSKGGTDITSIDLIEVGDRMANAMNELSKRENLKINFSEEIIRKMVADGDVVIFPSFPDIRVGKQRGNDCDISMVFCLKNPKEEGEENERFLLPRNSLVFLIDGSYFSGPAIINKIHGAGKFIDPFKQDHFAIEMTGVFFNSELLDQDAVIVYRNNSGYRGNSQLGFRNGKGVMSYQSGEEYYGEWLGGLKEGQGVYKWANGDKYDGEFKCDMPWGEGVLELADGHRIEGVFEAGNATDNAKIFDSEGNEIQAEDL